MNSNDASDPHSPTRMTSIIDQVHAKCLELQLPEPSVTLTKQLAGERTGTIRWMKKKEDSQAPKEGFPRHHHDPERAFDPETVKYVRKKPSMHERKNGK